MRVTFNELAERELNDAAQYYELEQSGLGVAFITGVRRCTEAIAEHPHAGPIILNTIRRRLCQRFPYGVLYTFADDELWILAVMNLRRRPGYWQVLWVKQKVHYSRICQGPYALQLDCTGHKAGGRVTRANSGADADARSGPAGP